MWTKFSIVVLTLAFIEVKSQFNSNCFANERVSSDDPELIEMATNVDKFGLDLFRRMASSTDKSIFISPYGIWSALGLAYLGARGRNQQQLQSVLGLGNSKAKGLAAMKSLNFELTNPPFIQPTFNTLDKAYFANDINLESCARAAVVESEQINFRDSVNSAARINNAVSLATNGKISSIVSPSDLSAARFMLLNAVYFKGDWQTKFDPKKTVRTYFFDEFNAKNISVVPLMVLRNTPIKYRAAQSLGGHLIELPYEGKRDVSMYAILPAPNQTFTSTVLERLTKKNLDSEISQLKKTAMDLAFPKFKMSADFGDDLKEELQRMGLEDLFTSSADFSEFTRSERLFADAIFHKAVVEVDETGTTAAAATGIIGTRSGPSKPVQLVFNRPFIYFIRHNPTKTTVFAGTFKDPRDTS